MVKITIDYTFCWWIVTVIYYNGDYHLKYHQFMVKVTTVPEYNTNASPFIAIYSISSLSPFIIMFVVYAVQLVSLYYCPYFRWF